MIRRALTWLILIPLVLILLISALAAFLVASEPGNRWLLARIQPHLPGTLIIEDWQGHLFADLRLRGIEYRQDQLHLQLDRLDYSLDARELWRGWLHLESLQLGNLALVLPPSADSDDGDDDKAPVQLPDSLALPMGVRLDLVTLDSLLLNGNLLVEQLHGAELAAGRRLNLPHLEARVAGTQLRLNLSGELSAPYPLTGALLWQLPLAVDGQPELKEAAGRLEIAGNLESLAVKHQLNAPLQLTSQGQLSLTELPLLTLDLQHQWPAQDLPLALAQPLSLGAGKLRTWGTPEALSLSLDSPLHVDQWALQLHSQAHFAEQRLTLETVQLQQDEHSLNLSGTLDLSPLAWSINLDGQLNPQVLHPELVGLLDFQGRSAGSLNEQGWQLQDSRLQISGPLRNQPLQVSLQARGNQQRLDLDSEHAWGDNRLQLRGQIGERMSLDASLDLAALDALDTPLAGSLSGNLQVRGSQQAPLLSGQLVGSQLAWQDTVIGQLDAQFSNLGLEAHDMELALLLSQIQQQDNLLLETLRIDGSGSQAQHEVVLQLRNPMLQFGSRLSGALDAQQRWQGQISDTLLREDNLGEWRQQQPSALLAGADRQQLETLCLSQNGSDLCLSGRHQADGQIAADLDLQGLPLALANPFLQGLVELEGALFVQLDLSGSIDAPQGQFSVRTEQALVQVNDPEEPQRLAIHELLLEGNLDNDQLQIQLDMDSELAELHSNLSTTLAENAPLNGALRFQVHSLQPLEAFSVDIRDVKGNLHGDLTLSGTLEAPLVQGRTALEDASLLLPALGIDIREIQIVIDGDPTGQLNLDGQARLGDGTLTLAGYLQPLASPLAVDLSIKGDRLLVANRPDAKAWLSPDLTIRSANGGIAVRGSVTIPEAAISPTEIPEGAVSVSEDQVFLDDIEQQGSGMPVDVLVNLQLGNRVTFSGFGLNARLGGDLDIQQRPEQPVQLNGEFLIHEGRYRAYGQNLAIEDGRLIFQGAPDNPGLDLRAIRRIPSENLVVGVHISGTLQDPRATIFSDPSVEESQAMAYLITGRSLDGGSDSDNAQIAQALALYGLEQGSGLTQRVGDTLGLDEIRIGSDWESDDAALMLGKQLSDRLYLTYAVGLFEAITTVMLRYTLSRQLHLEAQSSTRSNSIDLIWQREFR